MHHRHLEFPRHHLEFPQSHHCLFFVLSVHRPPFQPTPQPLPLTPPRLRSLLVPAAAVTALACSLAPGSQAPFPLLTRSHVFCWGMGLAPGSGPLLAALFIVGAVSAGDDCLWYSDKQGNWHIGFDCSFLQFCCGNCTYRYCCQDPLQLITKRQQKYCASANLSPTTVAGIASAILLFIVIIGIIVCCFLCSCCYLYRRRDQLRQRFTGPREVVHTYPMQPAYPSNVPPGMHAPYPTAPAYEPRQGFQSYPTNPAYPPTMPPGSYVPYPTAPVYGAATGPPHT